MLDKNALLEDFADQFKSRKFAGGLLVAFVDFVRALGLPKPGIKSFDDLLRAYPRESATRAGSKANQLLVRVSAEKTLGIRPFYNAAERYFRVTEKRVEYPSCAPHATGQWVDHVRWLDALCRMNATDLEDVRAKVVRAVLKRFPKNELDPKSVVREPPLFQITLDQFDLSVHAGDDVKTGAPFQGLVFGFVRADNPHLQVEIDKVRTGSSRRERVGDIDAWDGMRLAISAEVKQYSLEERTVRGLQPFAAKLAPFGAIGLVVALSFATDAARKAATEEGLHPLDLDDLRDVVSLWDPMKQRTAVASMLFYYRHVERSLALAKWFEDFLKAQREKWALA